MIRPKILRGDSIVPLLTRPNQSDLYLTKEQCCSLDFITLPFGVNVTIEYQPNRDTTLHLMRSGNRLRATIDFWNLAPSTPEEHVHDAVMEAVLLEAKWILAKKHKIAEYGDAGDIVIWTSRNQTGDEVLSFVKIQFKLITERAQEIIEKLAGHYRN